MNLKVIKVEPIGDVVKGKFYSRPLYYQRCELTLENGQVIYFHAKSMRKRDLPRCVAAYKRAVYHSESESVSIPVLIT